MLFRKVGLISKYTEDIATEKSTENCRFGHLTVV